MRLIALILGGLFSFLPAQVTFGADTNEIDNVRPAQPGASSRVYVVPVQDEISGKQEVFLRRAVREANEMEAEVLILDMKTPGGSLAATMEIFDILDSFNGMTVTYVNDEAYSAGALIAAATNRIFMAPDSVIGAATAIMIGPGGTPIDLPDDVKAKFSSAMRAKVRSKANKNGHNFAVFEVMIDMKKELVVDGEVISEEGDILTLTAEEATKKYGDPAKPLLAEAIIEDLDGLIEHLGYQSSDKTNVEYTGTELVGAWLTSISPILLLIAMVGLYMEFQSPGFGVPGLIGIVSALLYFLGGYVAGFSALGWLVVFIIGVLLIFGEVFLFPGTFVLGVTGAVMMALSITMAFLDYDPNFNPSPTELVDEDNTGKETDSEDAINIMKERSDYFKNAIVKRFKELGAVMIGFIVSIVVLAKVLPKTPFYSRVVSQSSSGVESVEKIKEENDSYIGQLGSALTDLKPGGKGTFGKDVLDVVSDEGLIEKGQSIRIVEFRNSTAVVIPEQEKV